MGKLTMNNGKHQKKHTTAAFRKNRRIKCLLITACLLTIAGFFLQGTIVDANTEISERYKYYTSVYVDRDTTLWSISKKYSSDEYSNIRVHMDEVKAINHLSSDELQYGTTLCVPYYSDELK